MAVTYHVRHYKLRSFVRYWRRTNWPCKSKLAVENGPVAMEGGHRACLSREQTWRGLLVFNQALARSFPIVPRSVWLHEGGDSFGYQQAWAMTNTRVDDFLGLLPWVSVSVFADSSPLSGELRIYVWQGSHNT